MSWDTFRGPYSPRPFQGPYLTQQADHVLQAVRQVIDPNHGEIETRTVYVTPHELLACVQSLLAGLSSTLYIWNPETLMFHLSSLQDEKPSRIALDGIDSTTSESLVRRFLVIGTLLRRIDMLVTSVWESHVEPVIHAFTHATSSILDNVRQVISDMTCTISYNDSVHTLTSLWAACANVESQLSELAGLCGRGMRDSVKRSKLLSQSAPELLSAVYQKLDAQLSSSSSPDVSAITAFILASISADYFNYISRWVGYQEEDPNGPSAEINRNDPTSLDDGGMEDKTSQDLEQEENPTFPSFFQETFCRALVRSRKSLKLLRVAQPDHPLLRTSRTIRRKIRWFWTENDITTAWQEFGLAMANPSKESSTLPHLCAESSDAGNRYLDGIKEFGRFDLEPDSRVFITKLAGITSHVPKFHEFLKVFPPTLPSLTPSLSILTDLVLLPLVSHVESLSTALVDTFLAPSSGYLKFRHHLILLRSYLMLTSPSFKSRLEVALFSDSLGSSDLGMAAHRATAKKQSRASNPWVIGLAPGLTATDSWPPAGADLSYLLRSVILDSLDHEYPSRQMQERGSFDENHVTEKAVYEEAEWRLGFVVRDLPTGSGQAKWLNPRSTALDFLYMNYRPPPALDILIPPAVLSKYHRLFLFNLRLLRVENVIKALFRMSSPGSDPLFQTITPSQKLFEQFRFMASSFVASLSSYIYNTAIGGNFDKFIDKTTRQNMQDGNEGHFRFTDVFALADGHSQVMDDILSACLLRSGQKLVGDLLRSILDVVLEFGILMGDLYQGTMPEYRAVEPLEGLYATFRKKMTVLVRALRSMVDKGTMSTNMSFEDMRLQLLSGHNPRGVGVTANLYDLLVRLDVGQWWTIQGRKRTK
ncbi:hypothetical protein BDW22DRAFT_1331168 [Trametopsis cervina]|nr:hypothetical protein BDW22DRAFT_1331168 [Trametopsis cervina]